MKQNYQPSSINKNRKQLKVVYLLFTSSPGNVQIHNKRLFIDLPLLLPNVRSTRIYFSIYSFVVREWVLKFFLTCHAEVVSILFCKIDFYPISVKRELSYFLELLKLQYMLSQINIYALFM